MCLGKRKHKIITWRFEDLMDFLLLLNRRNLSMTENKEKIKRGRIREPRKQRKRLKEELPDLEEEK